MEKLSAIEILSKLVSFPTVSNTSNLKLVEWVENYLLGFGIESYRKYNADGDLSLIHISEPTRPY